MPIGEDQEWQQTFDEQRVDGYAIMQQLDEVEDVCEAIVRHDSPAVLDQQHRKQELPAPGLNR